mmetsp:Transcript_17312/g.43527  ORF Transcript_17312/g.43527 Transcript_17312/m.43527 type:complete len:318 (+) Transcript_17312:1277-2230(+)
MSSALFCSALMGSLKKTGRQMRVRSFPMHSLMMDHRLTLFSLSLGGGSRLLRCGASASASTSSGDQVTSVMLFRRGRTGFGEPKLLPRPPPGDLAGVEVVLDAEAPLNDSPRNSSSSRLTSRLCRRLGLQSKNTMSSSSLLSCTSPAAMSGPEVLLAESPSKSPLPLPAVVAAQAALLAPTTMAVSSSRLSSSTCAMCATSCRRFSISSPSKSHITMCSCENTFSTCSISSMLTPPSLSFFTSSSITALKRLALASGGMAAEVLARSASGSSSGTMLDRDRISMVWPLPAMMTLSHTRRSSRLSARSGMPAPNPLCR